MAGPTIAFSHRKDVLRVEVTGQCTLENTLAYWQAIEAEVRRQPAMAILLIDDLVGDELTASQWHDLVEALSGHGLEPVRIAHVRPRGLQKIEYCEIFARDAGFQAHVFDNEVAASLWLRYGEG